MMSNSVFTLAISELGHILVCILTADNNTAACTSQVPVTLLISAFEDKFKSFWPSFEVTSVNAQ